MGLYNDQILTLYRVENGYVVECREPKTSAEMKAEKKDGCCMPSEYETKNYTAGSESEVLKIVKEKLGVKAAKEYEAGFKEATSKSK